MSNHTSRPRSRPLILVLLAMLALGLAVPDPAWARSKTSSGGYSRPAASHSRTPSTRASAASRARTPSTSGGYSRLASAAASVLSPGGGSASDRALSGQSSRQALDSFRSGQAAADGATRRPSTQAATSGTGTSSRRPSYRTHAKHAGFLDDLEDVVEIGVALASLGGSSRAPAASAPVSSPSAPSAPAPAASAPADDDDGWSFGAWLTILVLVAGGGFFVYLVWRRARGARTGRPAQMSGSPARPQWFRVGMTLPVDPSLFILAAPLTAIEAPVADTASGLLSVETLGTATSERLTWYRLHVSGGRAFFQVHLDARGQPDECRYFSLLDEVAPADADEWGFWLDANTGMIGWPEFQTRDGRLYQRRWSPGATRIPPRIIDERLDSGQGAPRQRREQAMLYARPTGAPAPAPAAEYLLVAAFEQEGSAGVTLHAGIDIPVASLQLS